MLAMFAGLLAIAAQALGIFDVPAWIGLHPDLAAGLSMLAVVGRIEDEGGIKESLDRIAEEFRTPIAEIKARLQEAEQKLDRRGNPGAESNGVGAVKYLKTKDGLSVPLLAKNQKLGDLYRADDGDGFNLGTLPVM